MGDVLRVLQMGCFRLNEPLRQDVSKLPEHLQIQAAEAAFDAAKRLFQHAHAEQVDLVLLSQANWTDRIDARARCVLQMELHRLLDAQIPVVLVPDFLKQADLAALLRDTSEFENQIGILETTGSLLVSLPKRGVSVFVHSAKTESIPTNSQHQLQSLPEPCWNIVVHPDVTGHSQLTYQLLGAVQATQQTREFETVATVPLLNVHPLSLAEAGTTGGTLVQCCSPQLPPCRESQTPGSHENTEQLIRVETIEVATVRWQHLRFSIPAPADSSRLEHQTELQRLCAAFNEQVSRLQASMDPEKRTSASYEKPALILVDCEVELPGKGADHEGSQLIEALSFGRQSRGLRALQASILEQLSPTQAIASATARNAVNDQSTETATQTLPIWWPVNLKLLVSPIRDRPEDVLEQRRTTIAQWNLVVDALNQLAPQEFFDELPLDVLDLSLPAFEHSRIRLKEELVFAARWDSE